jgi:hypothetical protein
MTKNSFQKLQTVINSNEQSYEQRGANRLLEATF